MQVVDGLDARGGAQAAGSDLVVVGRPTPTASCGFFSDGFESGDQKNLCALNKIDQTNLLPAK